ncbi:hypothetical protein PGT21_025040 [Puccinia graminis f. sp. tritici]|uniref:Uncharacterized protein n=2 Tax=Puccinia graminis f. sp. tritici TaxID=56615 RepID=A0A5B0NQ98_PUCGR|nr:hypothetical protein PGT21_025040 [Puccinia graminis f. sp. tritici]
MAPLTRASTRRSVITPPPKANPPPTNKPNKKRGPSIIPPSQLPSPGPSKGKRPVASGNCPQEPNIPAHIRPRPTNTPTTSRPHHPPTNPGRSPPCSASSRPSISKFLPPQRPRPPTPQHSSRQTQHYSRPQTLDFDISIKTAPPLSPGLSYSGTQSTPDVSLPASHTSACASQSFGAPPQPPSPGDYQERLATIVASVPEDLKFFLLTKVPYRRATIRKFDRIIHLVYPSVKFTGSPKKDFLFDYFQERVAPLFAEYFERTGECPAGDQLQGNINVNHINIQTFDPNLCSHTKAILRALICKVKPEIKIHNLNKAILIEIFYRVYKPHQNIVLFHPRSEPPYTGLRRKTISDLLYRPTIRTFFFASSVTTISCWLSTSFSSLKTILTSIGFKNTCIPIGLTLPSHLNTGVLLRWLHTAKLVVFVFAPNVLEVPTKVMDITTPVKC